MNKKNMSEFDVIVCGGGPAGICAAIAASRAGANTLLIERYGFLGGTATLGLCVFGMFDSSDSRIVDGIPEEIIQEMVKLGAAVPHVPHFRWNRFTTFEPWALKVASERLALDSNVSLFYHTTIIGVHAQENRIQWIETWNKEGRSQLKAKVFIDTTGGADIVAGANVPFVIGRESDKLTQSPTTVFRLAGFDKDAFVHYLEDNPQQLRHPLSAIRDNKYYGYCGLNNFMKHFNEEHQLNMPREFVCFHCMPSKKEISFVASRYLNFDPLSEDSLTKAEIDLRRQTVEFVRLLQEHVPGFEKARMTGTGHQLGIRESRRLIGEYILTSEDIIHASRSEDIIAMGGFPIDVHSPDGKPSILTLLKKGYGIPYRCLWSSKIENLLVAGRAISTTHEAYGSTRIIGTCMATGQAAGLAAAWAAHKRTSVSEIDGTALSQSIQEKGWLPQIKNSI